MIREYINYIMQLYNRLTFSPMDPSLHISSTQRCRAQNVITPSKETIHNVFVLICHELICSFEARLNLMS